MANPVVDAILGTTKDPSVREAMLVGSYLESGWNPRAVGDSGHSFGAFQINLPSHPGVSSTQASDPKWAADYMYGQYVSAVFRVNPSLWITDPEQAAEKAAYFAERPAQDYYVSRGASAVDQAWANTVSVLRAAGQPLGPGGAGRVNPSSPPQQASATSVNGDGAAGTAPSGSCFDAVEAYKRGEISAADLLAKGCPTSLGPTGVGVIDTPIETVTGAIDSTKKALEFLFSIRFLEIVSGGLLILLGLFLLGRQLGVSPPVAIR